MMEVYILILLIFKIIFLFFVEVLLKGYEFFSLVEYDFDFFSLYSNDFVKRKWIFLNEVVNIFIYFFEI